MSLSRWTGQHTHTHTRTHIHIFYIRLCDHAQGTPYRVSERVWVPNYGVIIYVHNIIIRGYVKFVCVGVGERCGSA